MTLTGDCLEPVSTLPLLWQEVFKKVEKLSASFDVREHSAVENIGNDLGASKTGTFTPAGDGSLQLIRQDGVLQAAEDIAAWLAVIAEREGLQDTLIIGSDVVLDRALYRFGLPVTGAAPEDGNLLLQLLPLILALGWDPPDPARIMELLTLQVSPVPSRIGHKLAGTLGQWPALGSELWQQELDKGIAAIEEPEKSERIAERMKILFTPHGSGGYPVTEIRRRIEMLTGWLRGRFQDDPVGYPALNQCRIFLTMVEAMGLEYLTEPLLKKLLDETTSALVNPPDVQAQAGLAAVPIPEAVLGPVRRIIWWNFHRGTVPALTIPLFSAEERDALTRAGVLLPESATLANSRAARWRRPLDCAVQQLILVCPQQDAVGEELHPHPLWDELLAASGGGAKMLISKKVLDSSDIPTITPAERAVPQPQAHWKVESGLVKPRDMESPSSLENFLGCPLKWCLNYNAHIRSGHLATLPNMVSVKGSLAHELVEDVLSQETLLTPEEGAVFVGRLFDSKAPRLVATLFQEGMEADREDIRNTVVRATRSLLQHLHDAKTGRISIEQNLSRSFASLQLQGRADIVLDSPFTVIDLKRSWAKGYKKKMASGTALQIVIYGWLLKETRGIYPGLAYYILEDQTFLTTDCNHFPGGELVKTPPIEEVWQAFEATFNEAWQVVKNGIVLCPGNGDEVESRLEDDRLIIEPPCRFCDYDVLCGRRFS